MAINLSKLKNLPAHIQIIIAVLPSVVLIALFIFFIFMPKNKEIDALNVNIMKLDQEIKSSESKIKRLDALIIENGELKKRLAVLKEQLPEEKEVSVLLKQVSELSISSGLQILLWKPEPRRTEPGGLYVEIPVTVEVLTDYHKFGDFLSHISRLPRLVNISDISLIVSKEKGNEEKGIIEAKFTARTFASVTTTDMPAATVNTAQ